MNSRQCLFGYPISQLVEVTHSENSPEETDSYRRVSADILIDCGNALGMNDSNYIIAIYFDKQFDELDCALIENTEETLSVAELSNE